MSRPTSGPGSRYVQVPAEAIEELLQAEGFKRTIQGREVLYVQRHRECNSLKIKVYTSIREGDSSARRRGKDSIKVCVAYENPHTNKFYGVGRFPHILRTGSTEKVLKRVRERIAAAHERADDWFNRVRVKQVMEA